MTPVTPELVEQVRVRVAAGKSFLQIGLALGVTKGTVAGLIRRHLQAQWDARPLRVLRAKPPPATPWPLADGRGCQYPTTNGRPWRFCDVPVDAPGSPWCAAHRRLCYSGRSWAA